ncbi:uncharacterized protein ASPGLDRAFT_1471234 [Aspergillus glaucus CBS 516.65]|uniref:RING-type domain-containing protein n=1 Tax=Aspergillus glaucus CBS 516.65 TaxID=1160497 RepID=A0A1L9VLH3_ASPGL|nr:hypothetical protein ASPGLDRAFT_1471234 [Aspergillus glaucus CBS 516.65]OJJ84769.1 hypothetical protein ASPGLDRAFT_1471234 [Aspergillus glaucus CBS 516.65]
MVLSLSVPSFSRSSSSSPTTQPDNNNNDNDNNQNNQNNHRRHRSSTSTKHPWRPTSVLSSSTNHTPSSSTSNSSSNILRAPFTTRTRPSFSKTKEQLEEHHREQAELNTALETLARVFPDVKVEVFREMLVRFDGNSRVEVCVEELLRHKKEWVGGRWNVPDGDNTGSRGGGEKVVGGDGEGAVPYEERFRSDEYKAAVKAVLGKEFTALSKSTVDAVLAEVNFCYHRARPTLRDLARRTWRATFNNLFPSFKRKKDLPRLKETGCAELDRELHEALLAPLLRQRQEEQQEKDFRMAEELNESEAKVADALYECECCLSDVTFEQISTCSVAGHVICYGCIQRTVHEALFGQGWNKSVDIERSTLKCLAPLSHGNCDGTLHTNIVKRAILLDKAGFETHRKFEDRLASEALLKSQYKLIRCLFCSYAEVDPVYHPSVRGVRWRFRTNGFVAMIVMTILFIDLICLLAVPMFILWLMDPSAIPAILQNSLLNLCLKIRPKRFTCAHPACRRVSCITCQKPWRDPHVCHEPLLLDLRATVEAARTAAVKRTCPRCGLSFVKSSGCNKLTCVCGYSMCYLCRKALGPPLEPALQPRRRRPPRRNQENNPPDQTDEYEDENDEPEEPEGYRHFCEHFRPNPGSRCTECNKCDLYQSEDEDAVARRAGERAEREWRIRQGMTGGAGAVPGVGNRNVNLDLRDWNWRYWMFDMWADGSWRVEGQTAVDWVVERVVVVDDI